MPSVPAALADPTPGPVPDPTRLRFAAMMVAVGLLHFVAPRPFRRIVPRWFPWPEEAVLVSGVAEVAAGVLVAVPRTRRAGGWLSLLTIAAVYPANLQMAYDATWGESQVEVPAWAAWLRVPMQFPMLRQAWQLTR